MLLTMAELDKNDLAQMNEDYFKSLDKERLVEVAKNLHQARSRALGKATTPIPRIVRNRPHQIILTNQSREAKKRQTIKGYKKQKSRTRRNKN